MVNPAVSGRVRGEAKTNLESCWAIGIFVLGIPSFSFDRLLLNHGYYSFIRLIDLGREATVRLLSSTVSIRHSVGT